MSDKELNKKLRVTNAFLALEISELEEKIAALESAREKPCRCVRIARKRKGKGGYVYA